ncbi:hypothetical protein F5X99DRAFT_12630 [Biscogniauxia marginata]|nr:hypothetical protein F5X99DRAFT_12630 [Biscogniauxia marginata]
MASSPRFHIRNARVPDDVQFIVEAFDSTLPYLTSIGSGEQWGSTPFSQKTGFTEETQQQLEQSAVYHSTGKGEALRVLIVEAVLATSPYDTPDLVPEACRSRRGSDGQWLVPVGAIVLREGWVPKYIKSQAHLDLASGGNNDDFVYIEVMITDYRTGRHRDGAGGALIQAAIEYAKRKGKRRIYVDGWAGNDRKLVRYYARSGFSIVGDYQLKRGNGTTWTGTLLQMDVGETKPRAQGIMFDFDP